MGSTVEPQDHAKSEKRRTRLSPDTFHIPENRIRQGYYTDKYFNRTREILEMDNHHPTVLMQVFQKNKGILCGIDEALSIIKRCTGYFDGNGSWIDCRDRLMISALYDGDEIEPYETVMTITGDLSLFAHLETIYLGILARRTRVATNTRNVVKSADGKPVLFFPARFDIYSTEEGDGYSAHIGGASSVSTDAQGAWWNAGGIGTIPHALIAGYGGDTVKATEKFARYMDEKIPVIALVDFDNDCVNTSLDCARAMGRRLWGVRLDTSGTLVDRSLWEEMSTFQPLGVCPRLVENVRNALDSNGFEWVKIIVSGGFNPEKIKMFESLNSPVDIYAVGSSLLEGNFDFTADVVQIMRNGRMENCSKKGRTYTPNPRLNKVL